MSIVISAQSYYGESHQLGHKLHTYLSEPVAFNTIYNYPDYAGNEAKVILKHYILVSDFFVIMLEKNDLEETKDRLLTLRYKKIEVEFISDFLYPDTDDLSYTGAGYLDPNNLPPLGVGIGAGGTGGGDTTVSNN